TKPGQHRARSRDVARGAALARRRAMASRDPARGRARGLPEGQTKGKIEGKREGKIKGKREGKIEGKIEGRREGKIEALLAVLTARGFALDSGRRRQIGRARDLA
ncbi:MAG TPA: hypothetical protein VIW28_06440, partial [Gemmatimonadales bacterium]